MTDSKPADQKTQTPTVFQFKDQERQALQILQQANIELNRSFAAVLSLMATEHFGYPVTEVTQFKLNDQLTSMEVTEHPELRQKPEDVPVNPAQPETAGPPTPPETPKSGAVAAA